MPVSMYLIFFCNLCTSRYLLIMKRPTNNDSKWTTFTAEFEVRAWLVLVMSLVAIHATLCLTSLQHPQRPLHPSDALMVVLAGLCGQGKWWRRRSNRSKREYPNSICFGYFSILGMLIKCLCFSLTFLLSQVPTRCFEPLPVV